MFGFGKTNVHPKWRIDIKIEHEITDTGVSRNLFYSVERREENWQGKPFYLTVGAFDTEAEAEEFYLKVRDFPKAL